MFFHLLIFFFFFFFNDTATTEIYTLSLTTLFRSLLDFGHDLVGSLERRAIGQNHRREEPALVLVGNEAPRRESPQPDRQRDHNEEEHNADYSAPEHPYDAVAVTVGDGDKPAIESREILVRGFVGTQEQRRKR